MPKAIMTVGCSASGKNTWVDEFVKTHSGNDINPENNPWVVIERDVIRFTDIVDNKGVKDWTKYKFTRARENRVTEIQDKMLEDAVANGQNVIICETNLNPKNRPQMVHKLSAMGFEVEFKEFEASLDELWKRDAQRAGGVGHLVIYKQYQQWLEYKGARKYVPNPDLPATIVFDVDGTLAQMNGRGPFDWKRVGEDNPRTEIIDMLRGFYEAGYLVVIASGRDGVCAELTKHWLLVENAPWHDFFIRPEGNTEKDFVIKERMLWEMATKYNIVAWVDDRPQVSNHLRLLGVNVIQVADPYVDF
ncbi:AAA family ATPase [bacterium]|nr:AAA family ATPase [bacterium]